ncbi:MAG: hypothetical protein OEU98_04910 [Actinomycetota bacterium]|nr:hypothetical protein [Actinomycetota bacterium]
MATQYDIVTPDDVLAFAGAQRPCSGCSRTGLTATLDALRTHLDDRSA